MTVTRLSIVIAVCAVLAAAGLLLYRNHATANGTPQFRLGKVERGDIRMSVSATGVLNPVQTVEVGSQVSGQISALDADYNTEVKADQVIARIDPEPFEARLQVARADLAVARANVAVQRASLAELDADIDSAQAMLTEAEADHARKRALHQRGTASQAVVDSAVAALADTRARLAAAHARLAKQEAQVLSAQAQVEAREATVRERELDLSHTVIRSPVTGVVIDRNVDIGQTVAASLQAPVLFTIAEDLRRMQVEISVDEADIGRVKLGQAVEFTVDAFPRRQFAGALSQIRKQPTVESNVVTYTVVALADNPDQALLPGMTANVTVVVGSRVNVLKLPEAALRYSPAGFKDSDADSAQPTPEERQQAGRARLAALIKAMTERLKLNEQQQSQVRDIIVETAIAVRQLGDGDEAKAAAGELRAQARVRIEAVLTPEQRPEYRIMQAERDSGSLRRGQVWLLSEDGEPTPVKVVVGISDDTMAELLRGELQEGAELIVGLTSPTVRR